MKSIIGFFLLFITAYGESPNNVNLQFADEANPNRIYIKVGEANIKKSLVAMPAFAFLSTPSLAPGYKQTGAELFNTIANDLDVSNLFTMIKPEAYLEDPAKIGLTPAPGNPTGFHFESWSKTGAEFLIRGGFKITGGKLEFEVYTYYVPQAKLVFGKKYVSDLKDVRTTGHAYADDLMKALTGKKGFFRTKFVVSSDRPGRGWKEIYTMDWDGRNVVPITNHHSISMSPCWNPNGKTIAYTSFAYHPGRHSRNADLFTYDLFEGKRYLVSSRTGINSGSTFSPDGQWIYLTLSLGGAPDIYRISLEGEDLKNLTHSPHGSLNVEPSISPDGKRIAFSSDRAGGPMIYVMDVDGSNIKRVTFAGQYNASPVFSPDGKKIAFAGRDKGHFDLFIMNPDGTDLERLTSAKKANGAMADNVDPSFSPDGRFVVFASNRSGTYQIYITGIDGTGERRITADHFNYFKPKWSPYLD